MDYEKAFKKIVEQIKMETQFAIEYADETEKKLAAHKDSLKNGERMSRCERWLTEETVKREERKLAHANGSVFAYRSICELALQLENESFVYEEEEDEEC